MLEIIEALPDMRICSILGIEFNVGENEIDLEQRESVSRFVMETASLGEGIIGESIEQDRIFGCTWCIAY